MDKAYCYTIIELLANMLAYSNLTYFKRVNFSEDRLTASAAAEAHISKVSFIYFGSINISFGKSNRGI